MPVRYLEFLGVSGSRIGWQHTGHDGTIGNDTSALVSARQQIAGKRRKRLIGFDITSGLRVKQVEVRPFPIPLLAMQPQYPGPSISPGQFNFSIHASAPLYEP